MAPVALAIQAFRGDHRALPVIAAGSSILFLLVLIRMAGLVREVESKMVLLDHRGVQLGEAEARYRTVVEHIPAITYLETVEGDGQGAVRRLLYASPQVETMLGLSPEECTDGALEAHIHPADRARIASAHAVRVASGKPLREEYRLVTTRGREVWVHEETVPVQGPEGSSARLWQGVMFDITGHQLAEDALRGALRREREATTQLRSLDEMKSTFLHAVSHDLRTPLASILGMAVTLDRDDLQLSAPDQKDLLGRLVTNARKLDRLVTDLLDLDRLDRGIVEPRRRPSDVMDIARQLIDESPLLGDRVIHMPTEPMVFEVDPAQVERIIENLLTNCVRHTPAGTPVWVRAEAVPHGVLIIVEDAGPGVAEESRAAIFEPFHQAPEGNRPTLGVGIGLSLVDRFARLHGGRAWVEGRVGGGASFRVFLEATQVALEIDGTAVAAGR
jgi:PAS domain S-box-containing protein